MIININDQAGLLLNRPEFKNLKKIIGVRNKMKKLFSIICLSLVLILFSYQAKAVDNVVYGSSAGDFEKIGASGSQFLKIGVGARANAMGGAYTGVANDITSIFWNPAGLADVKGLGANFSYTQWFADFSHNFAAVAAPLGESFTVAAHAISFSSDPIPITTMEEQQGTGSKYTVSDVEVGLSFSGYLTDQFSFGITAKYIQNSFASLSSDGIAFDVGTKYYTGIQGITLGFAIFNLGTTMQYMGQDLRTTKQLFTSLDASPLDAEYLSSSYNIPLIFRAGLSSEIINIEDEHKLLVAADFFTYSDVPEQFALGAEYTWHNLLSLRAGYLLGQDSFGFSGGAGIQYIGGGFNGSVNYSISPLEDFTTVHRISIGMKMD